MTKKLLLPLTIILFSSYSGVFGQKVQVDVDQSANFAVFKTFGWDSGTVARNPIIAQMIISAIESELTRRGLTRNDGSPDIKVAVMAAVGIDMQGVGPTWNNDKYKTWGGYRNPAALMNIPSGNMLVDLLRTSDNVSVFRGVSKSTLPRSPSADAAADAKSVEKHVQKAVKKIFDKYPNR
jgi:hypothetical protein